MKLTTTFLLFLFIISAFTFSIQTSFAGEGGNFEIQESDNGQNLITVSFFDLRERETFVQATNSGPAPARYHVQIFNVADNCNENNFFDNYTGNDTHVYNIRDILTNDGNPSGVVLPDNSYGLVVISNIVDGFIDDGSLMGNFRVVDNSGYEYRTNSASVPNVFPGESPDDVLTFNFNTVSGVSMSDVIGITLTVCEDSDDEVCVSDILNNFLTYDIDIYDLNEVPFSCRDVIISCVNQESPLLEELLAGGNQSENFGDPTASVASFEYGINDAIPHSRGGELLCPGNNISDGFVRMTLQGGSFITSEVFVYAGLNNGNGRGSMDHVWSTSCLFNDDCEFPD